MKNSQEKVIEKMDILFIVDSTEKKANVSKQMSIERGRGRERERERGAGIKKSFFFSFYCGEIKENVKITNQIVIIIEKQVRK